MMTLPLFAFEILLAFGNVFYLYALIESLPSHERPRAMFHGMMIVVLIRVAFHLVIDFIAPLSNFSVEVANTSLLVLEVALLCMIAVFIFASVRDLLSKADSGQHFADRFNVAPKSRTVLWQSSIGSLLFSLESSLLLVNHNVERSLTTIGLIVLAFIAGTTAARPILRLSTMKSHWWRGFVTLIIIAVTIALVETRHPVVVFDLMYFTICFLVINYLLHRRYRIAKANVPKFYKNE